MDELNQKSVNKMVEMLFGMAVESALRVIKEKENELSKEELDKLGKEIILDKLVDLVDSTKNELLNHCKDVDEDKEVISGVYEMIDELEKQLKERVFKLYIDESYLS